MVLAMRALSFFTCAYALFSCVSWELAAAAATGLRTHSVADAPAYLVNAFALDGFDVIDAVTYNGQWGLVAQSHNATIGLTGMHKKAFYVEGNGYEMGYLRGFIAENETNLMTSTYLDHILPSLISPSADAWLQNSTFAPVYDALIAALADLVVNDAVQSFVAEIEIGAIPNDLVDEMRGIADGAKAANPLTSTTFERIATLNYGYDYLLALTYSGNILNILTAKAEKAGLDAELVAIMRGLPANTIKPPMLCDAFAATGSATTTGNGSIFARDFQFSLAMVFQDVQAPTIHVPSDGRLPLVNVGGPGFVGAMTAMNSKGVAMGVDVMQAGFANWTNPGLDSLLMVRAAMHAAENSEQAVQFVAAQQRGVSWLYPLSDASGDGRVIESGMTIFNGSLLPDYRIFIENDTLRELLPDAEYLQDHIDNFLDYRYGIFVRNMSVRMPLLNSVVPFYNPTLFDLAGVPYPNETAWLPGGSLWANWTSETAAFDAIAFHYFSPEHLTGSNTIAVSNLALVPHMRMAGMSHWCSQDDMGSPQWRYDTLSKLVSQAASTGSIDLRMAQTIITFLSPQRTPGMITDGKVHGIISACDLQAQVLTVKGGYWIDQFVQITLPRYLHA